MVRLSTLSLSHFAEYVTQAEALSAEIASVINGLRDIGPGGKAHVTKLERGRDRKRLSCRAYIPYQYLNYADMGSVGSPDAY